MKVDKLSTVWTWTVLCGLMVDIASAVFTEYKNLDVSSFSNCCGATEGCQAAGSPNYYRYIEPSDADPNVIYVGAMNYLFALNTSEPELSCKKSQYLPQDEVTRGRCTRQGKAEIPDCQNHIREILEIDGFLEVCGTGAYAPRMYYLNVDNMNVNRTGDSTKLPTCPYDPLDNNTLLYSKYGNPGNSSAMYFGFYMDFIKNFPVFLRPRYSHESVTYVEKMTDTEDVSWLDSPQFVGSFDMSNSVLMFFRENAVEYQETGDQIYSRVGKVCKNDLGGGSVDVARKKWLSFQKARLICSLPGTQPYYFDDIYDVAYDGSKYFYALFYKPGAHLNASAICVYDMEDITAAFGGSFMFKNGTMVKPNPEPRLDDCDLHDTSPSTFNGLSSHHQLMYTRVQPVSGEPIFYRHGNQLLRLALGPLMQNKFRNIYVGTSKGEIWDIYVKEDRRNWQTYLNAKLLPFANTPQPNQAIWKIMMKDNYLITGTDYQVTKVPLDFCDQIREKNSTAERNLDECLYNTRCKLASCGGAWKCVPAVDSMCERSITLDDVPPGRSIRQYILQTVKPDAVKKVKLTGFKDLYQPLSIDFPLRLESVQWKKEETYLDNPSKYAFSRLELVVKKLDNDDQGNYFAYDSEGNKVAEYVLTVDPVSQENEESAVGAWKQAFIDWSEAFNKWKSCAEPYLERQCNAVP